MIIPLYPKPSFTREKFQIIETQTYLYNYLLLSLYNNILHKYGNKSNKAGRFSKKI